MLTSTQTLAIILTASICTFLLRVAPFAIFAGREIPAPVQYLGKVLPATVMALLVVYCLKSTTFFRSFWLPAPVPCGGSGGGAPSLERQNTAEYCRRYGLLYDIGAGGFSCVKEKGQIPKATFP